MSLYSAATTAVERTGYGSRYDRIFDMFHPIDGRIPAVCYKRLLETINVSGEDKDQLAELAGSILADGSGGHTSFTRESWRAALLLANVAQDGLPFNDPAQLVNVDTLTPMDFSEEGERASINVSASTTGRSQTPLFGDDLDDHSIQSTSESLLGNGHSREWNPEEQEALQQSQLSQSQLSHTPTAPLNPQALVPDAESGVWSAPPRPEFAPNKADTVTLAIVPEREGMFLFRHVNYSISSVSGTDHITVIRRYSDFAWLQDYLLKKYCFRQVPLLPPKRLAVNGHYLSSDNYFLERRRRGLTRFINQVLRHPVLGQDEAVRTFVSLRNDISGWKKSVLNAAREEFHGRTIDPKFVQQWDEQQATALWAGLITELDRSHDSVVQLCVLLDRVAKRQEAQAVDAAKIAYNLGAALPPSARVLYSVTDDGCIQQITRGLSRASARIESDCQLQQDEARGSQVGVLEEAKKYREALGSMRELFDRLEKYGGNNIPLLEKRIQQNQGRVTLARQRKALMSEIEKLDRAIKMDTEMIAAHKNRTWLIRECITEEIGLFQKTQLQISKLLQEFSVDKIKYAELYSDNWGGLDNDVMDLPV
ncbi:Sorting nexin MVP1 [Yarrowia sp. B02]|nr:Sorting nexin MVP1 [Yarrowia sp. B02]